jgi:hypothetical protein
VIVPFDEGEDATDVVEALQPKAADRQRLLNERCPSRPLLLEPLKAQAQRLVDEGLLRLSPLLPQPFERRRDVVVEGEGRPHALSVRTVLPPVNAA